MSPEPNLGLALNYRFAKGARARVSYAQSNRAPTPVELSCADKAAPCSLTNFFVADPALKQVIAQNLAASIWAQPGGPWHLEWQLSAYRSTSANDIQFLPSVIRGRAYFRNIGTTLRQGVDLSTSAHRGPWTLRAGYSFTDATFRSAFVLNSVDNPGADSNGQIAVRRGDRLPSIPRHRATLSVAYDRKRVSIGADAQFQSGQILLGDEANLQSPTRDFALFGVHGSAQLTPSLSIFADVRNLFNAKYATFGTFAQTSSVVFSEAPGASDPRSLSRGAPRRWSAGLRARL